MGESNLSIFLPIETDESAGAGGLQIASILSFVDLTGRGDNRPSSLPVRPVYSAVRYMKCAVLSCNNYFDSERQEFMGISYFAFPDDPELKADWIKAIGLPSDKDTDRLRVCSDHFLANDYNGSAEEQSEIANDSKVLKPGARPSVNLVEEVPAQPNNAPPVRKARKISKKIFGGFDNPLMDTSKDVATKFVTSDVTPAMPAVENVADSNEVEEILSEGDALIGSDNGDATPPKKTKKVEISDLIGEEEPATSDEGNSVAKNPEKGLIVVPALVKLPPRVPTIGLVGDDISFQAEAPKPKEKEYVKVPVANPASSEIEATPTPPPQLGDTLSSNPIISGSGHTRLRRRRRRKAELQQLEEEDEWEPSFWGKRTLEKHGFGEQLEADKRRKRAAKMKTYSSLVAKRRRITESSKSESWWTAEPTSSQRRDSVTDDESQDPSALLEVSLDVDESANVAQSSPPRVARRRPGPASKTQRPPYSPGNDMSADGGSQNSEDDSPPRKDTRGDATDVYDSPALLVEWAFFKSLIPDMGKLGHSERTELKKYILETLIGKIYGENNREVGLEVDLS